MEHDGLYDTLLLLGLLWRSMLFYGVWLRGRPATSPTTLTPAISLKNHSKEPKPFAGLLRKPLCATCSQAAASRPQAPCAPPPLLAFTRGRQRTGEIWQQCCPDDDGSYYGWVGQGNIRANGPPGGKPWRQFQCVWCQGYCQDTHGTPLYGKRVSSDLVVWAVGALAEAHSTEFSGSALRYAQYAWHFNMLPPLCLIHTHHCQPGAETWCRPPKRHAKIEPSPSISRSIHRFCCKNDW